MLTSSAEVQKKIMRRARSIVQNARERDRFRSKALIDQSTVFICAVVSIQRKFRKMRLRRYHETKSLVMSSVLTIQRLARGFVTRTKLNFVENLHGVQHLKDEMSAQLRAITSSQAVLLSAATTARSMRATKLVRAKLAVIRRDMALLRDEVCDIDRKFRSFRQRGAWMSPNPQGEIKCMLQMMVSTTDLQGK